MAGDLYIITWDVGYGAEHQVELCSSQDEALELAYDNWRESAEQNAIVSVQLATPALCDELSLDYPEAEED
jgi:hypothetical protein